MALIEGEDFYYNEAGLMVLTRKYHLQRGFCCGNGCRHCPFQYINVPQPERSKLLQKLPGRQEDRDYAD